MVDTHNSLNQDRIDYVQLKRFLESLTGDPETRNLAGQGQDIKKKKLLELGVHLSPEDVEPLWDDCYNYRQLLKSDKITNYPLLEKYINRNLQKQEKYDKWSVFNLDSKNELLNAWRRRMHCRSNSETGVTSKNKAHLLFAYELSKGCSVGCWFCGFSPETFKGYVPYTSDNARLWRDILKVSRDICGEASDISIMYHATEPFDNPDYFKFLDDFQAITRILPQTTTAVPFRNLDLTKEMLKRRKDNPVVPDRFSVLNRKTLHRIHREYTPLELEHVWLVMNYKDSLHYIAASGRARNKQGTNLEAVLNVVQDESTGQMLEPTTIECTYGFLVNLFDSSLKLISPCIASDKWPLGYRVHHEGNFRDHKEYKELLKECIETKMPRSPDPRAPLAFRSDLTYKPCQNGFTLISPYFEHEVKGHDFLPLLGDAIAAGNKTPGEIAMELVGHGVLYPTAINYLQLLFERGLLADELD